MQECKKDVKQLLKAMQKKLLEKCRNPGKNIF